MSVHVRCVRYAVPLLQCFCGWEVECMLRKVLPGSNEIVPFYGVSMPTRPTTGSTRLVTHSQTGWQTALPSNKCNLLPFLKVQAVGSWSFQRDGFASMKPGLRGWTAQRWHETWRRPPAAWRPLRGAGVDGRRGGRRDGGGAGGRAGRDGGAASREGTGRSRRQAGWHRKSQRLIR